MTRILTEEIDLSEVRVDREKHVIRGVKLSGRRSRNQRQGRGIVYSDQAIEQSVKLFESCPVTIRGAHQRNNRDYNSQNGQLRSGEVRNLGTDQAASYFEWHLNASDPLTPKLLEDAERFPQNCPLSQEVLEWRESINDDGDVLIESLTTDPLKVGVAVVYRGGINNSLFESLEDEEMEIKTKEELRARYGPLCEELVECACAAQKTNQDELKAKLESLVAEREAANQEIEKLKGQLEEYRAVERRTEQVATITAAAKEIVAESYEVNETLLEDLLGLFEGDAYKRVLTEIAKHYHADEEDDAAPDGPTSKSGTSYRKSTPTNGRSRVGLHNRR